MPVGRTQRLQQADSLLQLACLATKDAIQTHANERAHSVQVIAAFLRN